MFEFLLLVSSIYAQSALYGPCGSASFPYAALVKQSPIVIPIVKVVALDITVSGNIQISDPCSFRLTDFVFYNGEASQWYGGMVGSDNGITLSDEIVIASATPQPFDYSLSQVPGKSLSINFQYCRKW